MLLKNKTPSAMLPWGEGAGMKAHDLNICKSTGGGLKQAARV